MICFKCDGKKIKINGKKVCNKCNGTGFIDSLFTSEIKKIIEDEVSTYTPKAFGKLILSNVEMQNS